MNCPNCDCPDEMDYVRMTGDVTAYSCLACDYQERRHEPPIVRHCPNCQSPPQQPCTQPTDTGRRDVKFFHSARVYQ